MRVCAWSACIACTWTREVCVVHSNHRGFLLLRVKYLVVQEFILDKTYNVAKSVQ